MYNWKSFLILIVISGIICANFADAIRVRGSRFSFRSRSYRSFRSYRSGSSFRASNYRMAPGMLRRMGGVGISKKQALLAAGSVYLAYKLRPKFRFGGGGWGYNNDYDDFAICHGSITGPDHNNRTKSFSYFVCPSEYFSLYMPKKYCCGSATSQYCCNKKEFYRQYGSLGTSIAVIVIACVLSGLFLCGCCAILLYCKMKGRLGRHNRPPQPQQVPTEDPSNKFGSHPPMAASAMAPAYPMNPLPSSQGQTDFGTGPGYPIYPPATSGGDAGPPYPSYQPPPPPNMQPPPYPGPM